MRYLKGASRLVASTALSVPMLLGAAGALAQTAAAVGPDPVVAEERPVEAMGGALTPLAGRIRTFEGDISPLAGRIRTFEGDIDPFVGRIRTFEGGITGLAGRIRTFEGDIDPYVGRIRTFWGDLTPTAGDLDPLVGRIRTFSDQYVASTRGTLDIWTASETSADYSRIAERLRTMESEAAATWGDAVQADIGTSFSAGFSNPFFTKWGIDLNDPATLSKWNSFDRQSFLLDWYDNLLNYSGMDRVDHWMNAINWTPKLTQVQGGGSKAVIGLVDFFVANDADVKSKVVYSGGYKTVDNAHGAAVGSLIVASHDGRGIMGIAPKAQVAAYNPFDETLSASWTDVKAGIAAVGQHNASVINLSLGVPGYTLPAEWKDVFTTAAIKAFKDRTIYVIAAGNDGVTQTKNIDMGGGALENTFIVVGSVDPNGQISSFSNTPGTVCLTDGDKCKETKVADGTGKFDKSDYLKDSGLLMNRFLVAPGEMILVSDGAGGVTRMSGTSFAAPLVSGAIALIHDRWPWLKNYPRDVAKIVLESAQDLGAPGVDPIYGHGLLDIEAAQSALDFDALKYYLVDGAKTTEVKVDTLRRSGLQSVWSTRDMYFTAFEKLDKTERDFLIPLSSRLFNSNVNGRQFQEYMYNLFMAWLNSGSGPAGHAGFAAGAVGFRDPSNGVSVVQPSGWAVSMRGRYSSVAAKRNMRRLKLHSTVEIAAPEDRFALAVGTGDGAASLGGNRMLQMQTDFDPTFGGANPLLGFASGAGHMSARARVAPRVNVTFGSTYQNRSIEQDLASGLVDPQDRPLLQTMGAYRANASTLRVDYEAARDVTFSMSYTQLAERDAFFGVRSLERNDFGDGMQSDGVTFSTDVGIGSGVSLFGSATMSRSHTGDEAQIQVKNATSSAFQVGLAKHQLFGKADRLRLTLAQPLTLERGSLDMKMVGVVDRETGEKGIVTQRFDIGAPQARRYVAEAVYGGTILGGRAEVNMFGRGELRQVRADVPGWVAGGAMRLAF